MTTNSASHSRVSSGASECQTPASSIFSISEQANLGTATSSLASTPPCDRMDSPTLPQKSVLHDVAEDPSENEGAQDEQDCPSCTRSIYGDESDFSTMWSSEIIPRTSCDYDLSDGLYSESDMCPDSPKKRGGPIDVNSPSNTLKSRISQRMPSLSRKPRSKRSLSSLSFHARSTPASRAPSIRSPSIVSPIEIVEKESPPVPALPTHHQQSSAQTSQISLARIEEPIDRKSQARTPLLPQSMERKKSESEVFQSPLQSPTIADGPAPAFTFPTSSTPLASTVQSPILSRKASTVSFSATRASQARSSTDLTAPSDGLGDAFYDEWADRLGHADFDVHPEPYVPVEATLDACIQLTNDWELARRNYLAHANRVSEDYGPTSYKLKLTEEKWSTIDAHWKHIREQTIARARETGYSVDSVPCLSERTALTKIPTIESPGNGKTLTLADNGEIVGPMVTYVSRIKPQSKKNAFMRFFSDLRLSSA